MDSIENITKQAAYMVSPGNHDSSCHSFGNLGCQAIHNNFTSFRSKFAMPYRQSNSESNMWYKYAYSHATFISISTETDYPNAPDHPGAISPFGHDAGPFGNQLAWLEQQLIQANNDRANRPWIIVHGHRAMYTTELSDWPIAQYLVLRQHMEPLFAKYNVDVYLAGHVHSYERNWPVQNNVVCAKNYINPNCTVHIVNGAAGNIEGHASSQSPQPYTAVSDTKGYGFAVMNITRNTFSMTFYDNDVGAVDSFEIVKS
jgi:hypothetical protein